MASKILAISLLIILSGGLFSCGEKTPNKLGWVDYTKWLSDNHEIFQKNKTINGVNLSFKYRLPAYIAYQELLNSNETITPFILDSITHNYSDGLSFQLKISTTKKNSMNLLYDGITSEQDYKNKIHQLSFQMDEYIYLKLQDQLLKPAHVHFERYNELGNTMSFTLVFFPEDELESLTYAKTNDFEIVLDDPFWNTGINHFRFSKKDIATIPTLKI